jgi:hypothetical protein
VVKTFFKNIQKKLGFAPHPPIVSIAEYIAYAEKQAAFVSQVTLYTYIKTRAGTQWPKLFENETYLKSLKIARWHIFGAAVADLALYLGSLMVIMAGIPDDQAQIAAKEVIRSILIQYEQDDISHSDFLKMMEEGLKRADKADWKNLAEGPNAFQGSADALIHWAPIADELKDLDIEIVRNSIHLRWINVRREIKDSLRPEEIKLTL